MPTGYLSFWGEYDVDLVPTMVELEDREELIKAIELAVHTLIEHGAHGTACRLRVATERVTGRRVPIPAERG